MAEKDSNDNNQNGQPEESLLQSVPVSGMYENWFLDYASYVIMERAVPALLDGFKPVQRRIMHAMKEMDDGRFHKVANIIGQTMQFHPHGDAAIGDALVNLGQKQLLIETQGNWGDYRTGDSAAAPRYIEARLSKFALEVLFNNNTTAWQLSYDGRKKEPIQLPVKFPLLLALGVEGIAVGLATKILPHNFIELIKGSIEVLKGKKTNILPDFPTGGMADFSNYNGGTRGGKVRIRANIEVLDKKTLIIRDIPYTTTTTNLIDSILKANDKGKIKIKKVVDNTAAQVEIVIELPPGVSPDVTIDALYAFTGCEIVVSPNSCVIQDEKPQFLDVNELLKISTWNTQDLLRQELEIKMASLEEKWHFSSLEKIFIENRIYRDIEECETWEAVIEAIDKGLDPFKKLLKRDVTEEDIVRLTEIRIKRISKFDSFKADEAIQKLEQDLEEVRHHLANLIEYAISYFKNLLEKYGKGRERKTQVRNFDTIAATQVAASNVKLFVNRTEGFIGTGLKKDEFVSDCADIADIITIRRNSSLMVTRVAEKVFVGKDILHVDVWTKGDERTVYNLVYADTKRGIAYAKRFAVTSITRDKEYNLGIPDVSKVLYLTANPNGESEVITVYLTQGCRARNKVFEFDFASLAIKGRGSKGNIVTRYPVRKVEQKAIGTSTIGGMEIWLDETVGRLNTDERGKYLGEFDTGDQLLVINNDGTYMLTGFDLVNRFEMDKIFIVEQFDPLQIITAVYADGERKKYFVKRFVIETTSQDQKFIFITEHQKSKLMAVSLDSQPVIEYTELQGKSKKQVSKSLILSEFTEQKGWKSVGRQLGDLSAIRKIKMIENAEDATEVEQQKDPQSQRGDHSSGTVIEWDLDTNKKSVTDQGKLFD